ncbi:Uncharacterised protein [Klebsiella pneumoniae subsp. pneumoniae]|nr:Uncharacterised protein [Klebsiella pneumoniae subsp. pneumoniae]
MSDDGLAPGKRLSEIRHSWVSHSVVPPNCLG